MKHMTATSAPGSTLGELIHQRTAELTPGERRVARTLFATDLVAGFETVAELAERSGVSGPTVLRFSNKLGFAGYAEFRRALRHELTARIDSPLRLYSRNRPEQRNGRLLDALRDDFVRGLESTFANLSEVEFDAVVSLLADQRRPIWTTGGRFTQSVAELLQARLYQLRPRTRVIVHTPSGRADAMLEVSRRDVGVVFDVRRYQKDTAALAENAKKRGARIVLVTDPWLSPVVEFADHVLTVDVDTPSPYDSMVSLTALVEALIASVVDRLGETSRRRLSELERVREAYNRKGCEAQTREQDARTWRKG